MSCRLREKQTPFGNETIAIARADKSMIHPHGIMMLPWLRGFPLPQSTTTVMYNISLYYVADAHARRSPHPLPCPRAVGPPWGRSSRSTATSSCRWFCPYADRVPNYHSSPLYQLKTLFSILTLFSIWLLHLVLREKNAVWYVWSVWCVESNVRVEELCVFLILLLRRKI